MTDAVVVLEQRLQSSSAKAILQLPLTAEERTVLRGRRTTSCGRSVLLQLPRVGSLQPGDLLGDQSGSTGVEVTAAPEALMRVQGSHPLELLQAAYHLGNRHVALELHEQELLLPEDSVLATMLEGRGLTVSRCRSRLPPKAVPTEAISTDDFACVAATGQPGLARGCLQLLRGAGGADSGGIHRR